MPTEGRHPRLLCYNMGKRVDAGPSPRHYVATTKKSIFRALGDWCCDAVLLKQALAVYCVMPLLFGLDLIWTALSRMRRRALA